MSMHPNAEKGFASAAQRYQSSRPGYPHELVGWLRQRVGIGPGTEVVELGAGTGKLTQELTSTGATVTAVEPLRAMAEELRQRLAGVTVVAAMAERTGLPAASADLVLAAQAFHWFANREAVGEIHRLLRVEGWLALIWNRRDRSHPIWAAVGDLVEPLRSNEPTHEGDHWRPVLEGSGLFGPLELARFPNPVEMSPQRLVDRVLSISFIAVLPPPDQLRLRQRLLSLWSEVIGDAVPRAELPYLADVFVTKRA